MTIVHDPDLGMESSKSVNEGGTTPFMAPELLVPSRFGLDKCTPTKQADIWAIAMVIYQVHIMRLLARAHIDSSRTGAHWNITIR